MTIYLSRLFLDNRYRQVRHALGDCHQMHRVILRAFGTAPNGTSARAHFTVLFRAEPVGNAPGLTRLLVQSTAEPEWSYMSKGYLGESPVDATNPSIRVLDAEYKRITSDIQLVFRLRAN